MIVIHQIPVLSDNYVYLIHEPITGATAAVDPAEAQPVLEVLATQGWTLSLILNTHHHWDHVGGNLALKKETGCMIVGSGRDRDRIPGIDRTVKEGEAVRLGRSESRVLDVPGHTSGHVAYWFAEDDALFCGDTLFAMGCGRLLEGSARELWASLRKLRQLPITTRIFCAHEYTQTNGRFALTVEPHNEALLARMQRVDELRRCQQATVPSTLAEELATNPFLRADLSSVRSTLGMESANEVAVFAEIRRRKDSFRG
jgi:hydroxyacylglutathione hydrolase